MGYEVSPNEMEHAIFPKWSMKIWAQLDIPEHKHRTSR